DGRRRRRSSHQKRADRRGRLGARNPRPLPHHQGIRNLPLHVLQGNSTPHSGRSVMIIAVLAAAVLLAWALDRAYRRRPYPRNRLAGSTNVLDRDAQRLEGDLVADERHYPATRRSAARWSWTRIMPGKHSPA